MTAMRCVKTVLSFLVVVPTVDGTPSSVAATDVSLLQMYASRSSAALVDSTSKARQRQVLSPVKPAFCTNGKRQLWRQLCGKWEKAIGAGAVADGMRVCCGSLPNPCRTPGRTCSLDDDCLVPSCSQEEWYLRSVEADADHAFRMFGKSTGEFRNCSFQTAAIPCAADDALFATEEGTDAALAVFLNLDAVELEATAWEVVQEMVSTTSAEDDVTTAHTPSESAMNERQLFSRRSSAEETYADVVASRPPRQAILLDLDRTVHSKRQM